MMTKVTTVRRQEAANMKTSTMVACVTLLSATFRLRHTWSDTVVVSAANLHAALRHRTVCSFWYRNKWPSATACWYGSSRNELLLTVAVADREKDFAYSSSWECHH